MNKTVAILTWVTVLLPTAQAQLTLPPAAHGSDGALVINEDTVIDLSLAPTRSWDQAPDTAGTGVYDPEQWAVVFKYSSVEINAEVKFRNHPKKAPVVWIVDGNVTLNDNCDIDLKTSANGYSGPGGGYTKIDSRFAGGGWGGDFGAGDSDGYPVHVYGGSANLELRKYGNKEIIPLVGGSPGFISSYDAAGAMLICAKGTLLMSSRAYIDADKVGSNGYFGTGGAVRLVANDLIISGNIKANNGRIALQQKENFERADQTKVRGSTLWEERIGSVPQLWSDDSAPTVKIISVSEVAVPPDPIGVNYDLVTDFEIVNVGEASILLETTNVKPTDQCWVRLTDAASGGGADFIEATFKEGDETLGIWEAKATIAGGRFFLQAKVIVE